MAGPSRYALVVDDDATIRNLVNLVLLREGFAVDTACDGVEAVLKLSVNEYHVIVLDLMMPSLSGSNVLEFLEQERASMFPHVLVMTAAGENEIERMVAGRPVAVVRKPFDIADFSALIRQRAAPLFPADSPARDTAPDLG